MDIRLSDWAKENDMPYHKAFRAYEKGEIPNAKKVGRNIFIASAPPAKPATGLINALPLSSETDDKHNMLASSRRNRAATITQHDRFVNIDSGYVPYSYGHSGNTSNISIREIVELCRKAYFNIASVRNVIDVMTEFSCSKIFWKGGNKTSRDFFAGYFEAVGLYEFQEKFYREHYRSGNTFVWKVEGEFLPKDIKNIEKIFGTKMEAAQVKVPIKYYILNPADVRAGGNISFSDTTYYKVLTQYELERLKNPRTEQDKAVYNSLSPENKLIVKNGKDEVLIELDSSKVHAFFYKKQDYEPFGVSLIFPVLEDLEWKAELKKIDKAITRTVQQAILLVTMGAEPEKGGTNPALLAAMHEIFKNESVGRVVVADWTTKAQFVIPEIGNILDPKKYQIVNEDIRNGLNDILTGGANSSEKFANQSIKVKVFMERLNQSRRIFIDQFLKPEVARIAKAVGFKSYPEPVIEDLDFKDELEYLKVWTRLIEIGVLTPEEGFVAMETGQLPTPEDSKLNQEEFRKQKEAGLYEPITGGPFSSQKQAEIAGQFKQEQAKLSNKGGRPAGKKAPQTTKKVKPMGGKYSAKKITDNIILASELENKVLSALKKKFKVKKLTEDQINVSRDLSHLIIANENPENWLAKISDYISNPVDNNLDRIGEIIDVSEEHEIDLFLASILYNSKI